MTLPSRKPAWSRGVTLAVAALFWLVIGTSDASDLFDRVRVVELEMKIPGSSITALRRDPRADVRCTIREKARAWTNVLVHLKGSTGSFQPIDRKPGFTLTFDRVDRQQRFHGRRKVHLNNSVEDPSYMSELLGSRMFRDAGIPATRVTYALVLLNGKRLGLYVLKEAFDLEFLQAEFGNTTGRLYEPGRGRDVGEDLDEKTGRDSEAGAELADLADAARESDPAIRWQRLNRHADIEKFVRFMALEVIIAHRDGYCLMRNNYRIYERPEDGRAVFLPHGMDQLFGMAPSTLNLRMNGLVARAVVEVPEGQTRYREAASSLLRDIYRPEVLAKQAESAYEVLLPHLKSRERRDLRTAVDDLKSRIAKRHQRMRSQLASSKL